MPEYGAAAIQEVGTLAVLADVEADDLVLFADPQAHDHVQDLEEDEGHDEGVAPWWRRRRQLTAELVEAAAGTRPSAPTELTDSDAEDAGGDGAPGPADAVHADHVQGVVQADLGAQTDREVAERAGD